MMAMPDSQRYPENLRLIKSELDIIMCSTFKTDCLQLMFVYKSNLRIST